MVISSLIKKHSSSSYHIQKNKTKCGVPRRGDKGLRKLMADEENGDTNDEVEDKEDEASKKLMVIHANVVNLGLCFR